MKRMIGAWTLRELLLLFAVTVTTWPMTACGGDDTTESGTSCKVAWIEQQTITADAGTATIEIAKTTPVGKRWQAEVVDPAASWVSFAMQPTVQHRTEGTFSTALADRLVRLYYTANTGATARTVTIRFTFDQLPPIDLCLEQPGQSTSETSEQLSWLWPEIPAQRQGESYHYVAHFAPVTDKSQGGKMVNKRNYSICFDQSKRASAWVAYPMHEAYLGSSPRPDEPWTFDPKIEAEWQADLAQGSYRGSWVRGHQIANADRNAHTTMQHQTFYDTNATPQNSSLNSGPWARLESRVRDWKCSDTLYVVTGAYWGENASSTTDKQGNRCPIPTHYFKVLARTVKGNTRTRGDRLGDYKASELMSIGFWVENKSGQGEAAQWTRSVAEIEQLTGFEFFPTLPAAVKQQKNPAQWGL